MQDEQGQLKRRNRVEALCSAMIRSYTGDNRYYFRGTYLYKKQLRCMLRVPHLRIAPIDFKLDTARGMVDSRMLRLKHTDEVLFQAMYPSQPVECLVYEWLEQFRVEALSSRILRGVDGNLQRRFEQWSQHFHLTEWSENNLGKVLYAFAHISRAEIHQHNMLESAESYIKSIQLVIQPLIIKDLHAIAANVHDQATCAEYALSIARRISAMISEQVSRVDGGGDKQTRSVQSEVDELPLLFDVEEEFDNPFQPAISGKSHLFEASEGQYQVFSRQYDRVIAIEDLVKPDKLKVLRETLDQRLKHQGVNGSQLTRQLAQIFAQPKRDDWLFGQEEGYLDGRRLTQLVTSTAERRVFQKPRMIIKPNACVTFLLDCSGSMKQFRHEIAMMMEILSRSLDRLGVEVEILGFSTQGWNGGRILRLWRQQGEPERPGRLNELCHRIFKDANTSWRHARLNLGALLKMDLYRENIDGEALEWACERLYQRDVNRRLLMVITDGTPLDNATAMANNDDYYLDNHLKSVIAKHEERGLIELSAIGVGLDLSPFYRRNTSLDLTMGLNARVITDIVELMKIK